MADLDRLIHEPARLRILTLLLLWRCWPHGTCATAVSCVRLNCMKWCCIDDDVCLAMLMQTCTTCV